ncbi:MAG: hypothetical protein MPW16_14640 [Candidatus Manganitrophus sp.]|nr:MAG: hypothetical protein MPW16_14640 [Candidatus Manganitrophus sp.]
MMKKGWQSGIFFLFLFALLAGCSNDPRNTGPRESPEPTGWSDTSDLSKGIFYALAADPTNPNVIYAASSTVSVYKTTDGGATWSAANRGLPGQPVRSLIVDPINPLKIYAALAGGSSSRPRTAALLGKSSGRVWSRTPPTRRSSIPMPRRATWM